MAYPPVTPPSTVDVTDLTVMASRHSGDHNSIADWLNVLIPGAWNYVNPSGGAAPAFASPWANYGGVFQPLRFRREGGDICRIEGHVAGGASGNAIFTLPLGYRPANQVRFIVQINGTSGSGYGAVDVNNAGGVYMSFYAGQTGSVTFGAVNVSFVIDPTSL